ncbi:hypothetical protein GYMLUDRAFT_143745, partial [Collybiopsis luxurians FD-317 M1]
MSLQLTDPSIRSTYLDIINSSSDIDWAIYTTSFSPAPSGPSSLKVQSTGSGGLSELEDEFYDGRIQYAFARVTDPGSQLPKFVLINWCGDGVPESKKGLFASHAAKVADFLKGAHVVISARNESDVAPSVIMKRVEAASGAKYSFQQQNPSYAAPSAPWSVPKIVPNVGSGYQPVGKVDMAALRSQKPPAPPTASRPSP